MSNRIRSIIRAAAVIIVLLAVLMELSVVIIPAVSAYKFWIVVVGFGLMLLSTR